MADRAGYTVAVYAIDVSPSMGDVVEDPEFGGQVTKLDLAKEFIARKCEPKISSGRKTEHVGIVSFGGETNNAVNQSYVDDNPDDDDPPYAAIACNVAIQTAKPKTLEEVANLQLGEHEGNPVSALMVALEMIHKHKHSKAWALEVMLVTDGESAFRQDEYEDVMQRFDEEGIKLSIIGIGFEHPDDPVPKTKSRNQRLSEKFWRTFINLLHESVSKTTEAEEFLPFLGTFEEALHSSRLPKPSVVKGTVAGIDLHIGSFEVDPKQAIVIPIKYSKATMKARPPTLSKAWKPAMDLQAHPRRNETSSSASNLLANSIAEQSQALEAPPAQSDLAAMISADVKSYSAYVVKRTAEAAAPAPTATGSTLRSDSQVASARVDVDGAAMPESTLGGSTQLDTQAEEEEEEAVAKEDIVKAWRFGSTWVPMEKDTFDPLDTQKGVEILGFFPKSAIKRHHLMGEVRFVWPDLTSPKAQIQFSSLVQAMVVREMVAVVRWVLKDQADPVIGMCVPEAEFPDVGKRLDYMFWVKLPFAEDEHNFWFPSLTTYKTSAGKVITEHPLLPTEEQCDLMDELVDSLDLDEYARSKHQKEKEERKRLAAEQAEYDDEEMPEDDSDEEPERWFDVNKSYNPVIHRIKEAIFHASLTEDLDANPLGPPHPELTKYFQTPAELAKGAEDVTHRLKESLSIKKVPPKQRKKVEKEALREDEGYIEIEDLFNGDAAPALKPTSTQGKVKDEPISPTRVKAEPPMQRAESQESDVMPPPIQESKSPAKPKRGRLISNQDPLGDFNRVIDAEGDAFRKAIQDLGAVVKENVEASFSRQAFPLAIECLRAMRGVALTYEEVETYNDYLDELEKYVNAPGFKHRDFWQHFEKAGKDVAKIEPEEAQAALEEYDE